MRNNTHVAILFVVLVLSCRRDERHATDIACVAFDDQAVQSYDLAKDFPDNSFGRALEADYMRRRATGDPAFWWRFIANKPVELSISFMNPVAADDRSVVIEAAGEWAKVAHVRFKEVSAGGTIRILTTGSKASWSEVGTRSLAVSKLAPTMRLGLKRNISREEKKRIAIHEFGHTLGLLHEHQHPCVAIQWDEPAIVADLAGQLTLLQIREQIEAKYSAKTVVESDAFDRNSIMLYPIPRHWTKNGVEFQMGSTISPEDARFVSAIYPARGEQQVPDRTRQPSSCKSSA